MSKESTLLMPFLDESSSFVHGFECGKLWNQIEEGETVELQLIHTENVNQIELMCKSFGVYHEIKIYDDTWAYVTVLSAIKNEKS